MLFLFGWWSGDFLIINSKSPAKSSMPKKKKKHVGIQSINHEVPNCCFQPFQPQTSSDPKVIPPHRFWDRPSFGHAKLRGVWCWLVFLGIVGSQREGASCRVWKNVGYTTVLGAKCCLVALSRCALLNSQWCKGEVYNFHVEDANTQHDICQQYRENGHLDLNLFVAFWRVFLIIKPSFTSKMLFLGQVQW